MTNKIMTEMERIYDVCQGADGVYADPLDDQVVIVCNKGKVMKLPKILFDNLDNSDQGEHK
ncbi:hypothetical protein R4576_18155 [Acinetobacter baumannii]|nr:hypothetical protein [Acinetobacter baumannii]